MPRCHRRCLRGRPVRCHRHADRHGANEARSSESSEMATHSMAFRWHGNTWNFNEIREMRNPMQLNAPLQWFPLGGKVWHMPYALFRFRMLVSFFWVFFLQVLSCFEPFWRTQLGLLPGATLARTSWWDKGAPWHTMAPWMSRHFENFEKDAFQGLAGGLSGVIVHTMIRYARYVQVLVRCMHLAQRNWQNYFTFVSYVSYADAHKNTSVWWIPSRIPGRSWCFCCSQQLQVLAVL